MATFSHIASQESGVGSKESEGKDETRNSKPKSASRRMERGTVHAMDSTAMRRVWLEYGQTSGRALQGEGAPPVSKSIRQPVSRRAFPPTDCVRQLTDYWFFWITFQVGVGFCHSTEESGAWCG